MADELLSVVELSTFSANDYKIGFEQQRKYIYTIYKNHGVELDQPWVSRLRGDDNNSGLVGSFLKNLDMLQKQIWRNLFR